MSGVADHCRSRPVTTACHGLTHSESWGPDLPATSIPLVGGRGMEAARARRGGRDGGRGLCRARYLPALCISPRCEAAARDSLMGCGCFGLSARAAVREMRPGPPPWLSVVHAQAAAVWRRRCLPPGPLSKGFYTRARARTHTHSYNGVGPEGALAVAAAVEGLTGVTSLDLS